MNAPTTGIPRQRILYIDKDAELGLHFKGWLEHTGHRVSIECSPRVALNSLSHHPDDFDLVVAEYRMPDLSGIEVARTIHDQFPHMRCAVVAGDLSSELIDRANMAGVGPVLRKPFTPREYEELIRRCSA